MLVFGCLIQKTQKSRILSFFRFQENFEFWIDWDSKLFFAKIHFPLGNHFYRASKSKVKPIFNRIGFRHLQSHFVTRGTHPLSLELKNACG